MEDGVVVPPPPLFTIGHSETYHVRFRGQDVGKESDQRSPLFGTMTSTELRIESNNVRVYGLMSMFDGNEKPSKYQVKVDGRGHPLAFVDPENLTARMSVTRLLFLMRLPIWPATKRASMWTTKIPSPSEQGAFLAVQCSAKYFKASKTIELSQAVKEFQVEAAIDAKLDSVITVESLTGRVTSIHDRLVLNENGKKIRTLWYDEEL